MSSTRSRARSVTALAVTIGLLANVAAQASSTCPEEQATPQGPKDSALCEKLRKELGLPHQHPLNVYETRFGEFLAAMCHRDLDRGWKVDKRVRDTGPWIGTYANGQWTGQYYGTHAPVLVWYSPEMYAWLKENRPENRPEPQKGEAPKPVPPVPDGAMMIKEMYQQPGAACAGVDPLKLKPGSQASAIMVRDSKGSYDGWFWGWYGWPGTGSTWAVDWPDTGNSHYLRMGFGQYCTNCHASAKDNSTFAALRNIMGEPNDPLVFLSQNFFLDPSWQSLQQRIQSAADKDKAAGGNDPKYDDVFTRIFFSLGGMPERDKIEAMPPETYDRVWAKPGDPTHAGQFLTSDQCIGCHSAGGTGLQYDMTQPSPSGKLVNASPYGTWRGSPMGLAGRDPIFFAQLASETDTFHKNSTAMVQDTCLGCHGIIGQRQYQIDKRAEPNGTCAPFERSTVNAKPYPTEDPVAKLAHYGALARDGISCTSCHHMVLGATDTAKHENAPQNACIKERQQAINPGLTGFAATFTGNFFVGPPDELYGPFKDPKRKPMKHAIGIDPKHNQTITSSELCGSCHTVHLPIMHNDKTIGHVYEQTTYPEWAFSDFRTGDSPDGSLPSLAGPQAQSCQGCHMPNKTAAGDPYRSKIAAIQEYDNFPQAEHTLPREDINLPTRSGYGQHTLVGLNVYLLKMAWQFPDILGIRKTDPMLDDKGIESIATAEGAMLDQAVNRTATVTVADVRERDGALEARVTVINRVGHKFPSGVGFRRAFIEFSVLDVEGKTLWSSGRTNRAGVIVDQNEKPIRGELWWNEDCRFRIAPEAREHQPHYQQITRQDQAQIYQELVAEPAGDAPVCGPGATPQGKLTTSFLSICAKVKDNRLLPAGFLGLEARAAIARKLGADDVLAEETGPYAVGDDPDYQRGGSDGLTYRVPLSELGDPKKVASVQATLYYQPTPPFYLQDRFCTSEGPDTKRLYYLTGKLSLAGTAAQDWKLRVVTSGPVSVPDLSPAQGGTK
jgi:hypothetical protein